jgi:hypothetical protein
VVGQDSDRPTIDTGISTEPAVCRFHPQSGRQLALRPQPVQQALDAARAEQTTKQSQAKYARRSGVESTIAQATKVTDTRRARYRGLAKTSLDHNVKAVALSLIRLDARLSNDHGLRQYVWPGQDGFSGPGTPMT